MSDAHIFQLLGLVYSAAGIRGIIDKTAYREIMVDSINSPALSYLFGLVALLIGFLLVTFHNEWSLSWSVIITIFGWIAFIEGILIIAFPVLLYKLSNWMVKKDKFLKVYAFVAFILGALFLILGFWVL
jgi:hypothetical protein